MPQISNQSVNIHYEVEGEGSPIMLLHGAFGSLEDWTEFGYVGSLRGDYKVILIDLRGHGQSDKPHDPSAYSIDLLVQDVVAVLDQLGIGNCTALGFSVGGWIVYSLLKKYPERIQSMIMLDGVPGPTDASFLYDFANTIEEPPSQLHLTPAFKARFQKNDKEAMQSLSRGIEDDIPRFIDNINSLSETINTPSLILTSDFEGVEMDLMKKIHTMTSSSSLMTFAGLTHIDLLMRGDLTIPNILSFLSRRAQLVGG